MNDINSIVFEVFKNVHEMDYSKNSKKSLFEKSKKLFRYLKTGYIFQVFKTRKALNKYNNFIETENEYPNYRFVIYTVNTKGYDSIKDPIYYDAKIDYFVFTDVDVPENSAWKVKSIPTKLKRMSSLEQARYIKTHPHEFFQEYDYSMFIDGNIRITCDVKPLFYTLIEQNKTIAIHDHQMRDCIYQESKAIIASGKAKSWEIRNQEDHYKSEKFPAHFGLFETNIVIRKHNDRKCIEIMDSWWKEINKYTKRDQMSFTYSLWKNNVTKDYVMSLGNNSRLNPYFIVDGHK